MLRSPIEKLQGKFSLQASCGSGILEQGTLNEDAYHALFAYCLLSGQVLTEQAGMPPTKQMAYNADSVLDPSNLTSRVTKLVAVLRRAQVSNFQQLAATAASEAESGPHGHHYSQKGGRLRLPWLLECLQPWYSKQGQATLTSNWPRILSASGL